MLDLTVHIKAPFGVEGRSPSEIQYLRSGQVSLKRSGRGGGLPQEHRDGVRPHTHWLCAGAQRQCKCAPNRTSHLQSSAGAMQVGARGCRPRKASRRGERGSSPRPHQEQDSLILNEASRPHGGAPENPPGQCARGATCTCGASTGEPRGPRPPELLRVELFVWRRRRGRRFLFLQSRPLPNWRFRPRAALANPLSAAAPTNCGR